MSQAEKKGDWIIDSGCSRHMAGDMNKFIDFNSCDEGIVRVGNNVACHIKGIGPNTLDGKTNTDDVYFFDGLKHNLLSVGWLLTSDINYISHKRHVSSRIRMVRWLALAQDPKVKNLAESYINDIFGY